MKTILLTGSRGFVGSNILNSNLSKKFNILSPTKSELDLINKDSIKNYLKENNPFLIIHAAGKVGGILKNISSNYTFLKENSLIGINLISAALESDIKNFLNISSSCIYPMNFDRPIKEQDLMSSYLESTNEGYALAKIVALKLTTMISSNKSVNYKTVVPCNLYGPNDNFNELDAHMIPAVIHKIHQAKKLKLNEVDIWGDGKARREFMFIKDFVDFILYSIDNFENMPQVLNVGTGKDYTIDEYYTKISKIIGYEGNFDHDLSKPSGMRRKLVDIDCLRSYGWKSSYSLEQGIRETYNYYLKNYENKI